MKYVVPLLFVAMFNLAQAAGEKKEVCTDKKNSKGEVVKKADGTPAKECKIITVHKKVEGEKVPDQKK